MITVVYLSNDSIKVLVGEQAGKRIVVKDIYTTTAPEGSIINGVVTDEESFTAYFNQFWSKNNLSRKDVSVIINSSQFVNRAIEVPMLNDKATLNYIPREFADVERTKDPVYNFFPLIDYKDKKTRKVFATMIERGFIHEHIRMFNDMNIAVTSFGCAISSSIKILQKLPQIQKKTCIIQILDDVNMTSILLIDGIYEYSSRSRMFNERGSIGFGVEVARSVSNILQFAQAQQFTQVVTDVYFGGISTEDLRICEQSIYNMNDTLHVSVLDGTGVVSMKETREEYKEFCNCIYPIGAFIPIKKQLNLYARYLQDPAKNEKKKQLVKTVAPIAVLAGVGIVATAVLGIIYLVNNHRLDTLTAYNTRADVIMDCDSYDDLQKRTTFLEAQYDAIDKVCININSYPIADSYVVEVLKDCAKPYAEVEVTSFDSKSGVFQVSTTAKKVELINKYVDVLRQKEIFVDVDYTGYTYQQDRGVYQVNVTCYLDESAGRTQG